jgi:hypothetical protein
MRPNIDAATLALYISGEFDLHVRIKVENGSGTMINLFGRYTLYNLKQPDTSEPIGSLRIDFIRETTSTGLAQSFAPTIVASNYNKLDDGVTYSPLLQLGRLVTYEIALTAINGVRPIDASTLWYEDFRGYIADVDWPEYDSRKASILVHGLAGVLQHQKSEAEYFYAAGTPHEDVAREILDNNGFATWDVRFPVTTLQYDSDPYVAGDALFSWPVVPITPGATYRVRMRARNLSGTSRNYGVVNFKDAMGASIVGSGSDGIGWLSKGTYHYWGVSNAAFPAVWTSYEFTITPTQIPSNAVSMQVGALLGRDFAGVVEFQRMGIYDSDENLLTPDFNSIGTSWSRSATSFQSVLALARFAIVDVGSPTGKVIPIEYAPGLQKPVWSQLWDLAQSLGWICYMRYTTREGPPILTFFEPIRSKVSSDMTIEAYDYTPLSIKEEELRNVGYLAYFNTANHQEMIGPLEDLTSLAKYGGSLGIRRPFWIKLEIDSPIRSSAEAHEMLRAALSDVANPDMIGNAQTFPLVFGEVGVDRYTFLANNRHFDSNQLLAPFSITVVHVAAQEPYSSVGVRGLPTAGSKTWARYSVLKASVRPEILTAAWTPRFSSGVIAGWDVWITVNEFTGSVRALVSGDIAATGGVVVVPTNVVKGVGFSFTQAAGDEGVVELVPYTDTLGIQHPGESFSQLLSRLPIASAVINRVTRTEYQITLRPEPASATVLYRTYLVGEAVPGFSTYTVPFLVDVIETADRILQFFAQIPGAVNATVSGEIQTKVLDHDRKAEVTIAALTEVAPNKLEIQVTVDDDCSAWFLYARRLASPIVDGLPHYRYFIQRFQSSISKFVMEAENDEWFVAVRGVDFNSLEGPIDEASIIMDGTVPTDAMLLDVRVVTVVAGGNRTNRVSWEHTSTIQATTPRYCVHIYEAVDSGDWVLLTPGAPDAPTRSAALEHDGLNADADSGSFNASTYQSCIKASPGCQYVTFSYRVELWDTSTGPDTLIATYYVDRPDYAVVLI